MLSRLLSRVKLSKRELLLITVGSFIMSFGIVNVHGPARITEGGVLGLILFSNKMLGMDASFVSVTLDSLCYLLGLSVMGWKFLPKALVATFTFAGSHKIFSWIGPVLPNLYQEPLIAAVIGGIFIGVGCGFVISQKAAAGGDDALAMVIAKRLKCNISWAYLLTDGVVLLLSLTYIAPTRLFFSFVTTLVSSFIIGQFEVLLAKPKETVVKIPKPKLIESNVVSNQTFNQAI